MGRELKLGLTVMGAFLVLAALVCFVFAPLWARGANKAAAQHVSVQTAQTVQTEAVETAKSDGKVSARIEATAGRVRQAALRAPNASNPDVVFFDSVCGGELYAGDSECRKRGGSGGKGEHSE